MANTFDSILENQKKVYEYWSDFTKKTMNGFNGNGHKTETPADLMKAYFERQKSLFEEFSKTTDPKEILEKSPDNFKKWMDIQSEFADRWMKSYRESAEQQGFKAPQFEMPTDATKAFESGMKQWADWAQQANDWIKENIVAKMPTEMQGHYKSFSNSYSDLYKYWESFSKMMQFGATQKEVVDKYFSQEAYKAFVDKFMGFKGFGNVNEVLDNANQYFEEFIASMNKFAPNAAEMSQNWKKMLDQMASSDLSPMFKMALDLNSQLQHNTQPFFNVIAEGKEAKAVKILRDIQFAYAAYVVKSADMQTKVYQAGSPVLPEILKVYYEDIKAGGQTPSYKDFYTQYINALENAVTVVLESPEYSVLQSDVAKTGVTVKAKYEELVELLFSDLPFVMKSQMDDLALENATLRKKLRDLENRLSALENAEKKR